MGEDQLEKLDINYMQIGENKVSTITPASRISISIALTDVCPLDCSYCCMEFTSKENNKHSIYQNNTLLDRIINLIDYLTDKGYYVELGSGWGEPLLIFKYIKYIFDNIKNTNNISYEILSSFSFDQKNDYKSVFLFLKKYITLFNSYNIPYTVRWSIHCEYLKSTDQIYSHYLRLKSAIPVKLIPMLMINTRKNIWQFKALQEHIPEIEYRLVLNNEGKCPLVLSTDTTNHELSILKSLPYYVRGIHIVDRIFNKNFSFTGTKCHLPYEIAMMPDGRIARCTNDNCWIFDQSNTQTVCKLLTEVTNEYVEQLATGTLICRHAECNICVSDSIDVYGS